MKDLIEKFRGITLVVDKGWATLVLDRTGHTVGGPVDSDDEVKTFVRRGLIFLREIGRENWHV